MDLLLIDDATLNYMQQTIVETVHRLTTTAGTRPRLGTIDPEKLRIAAQVALQIATGSPVWPESEKLSIRKTRENYGPIDFV